MTNGEKIQTILNIDQDCTEVYGKNGMMTFSVTQDWWEAEYKEPTTKNNLAVDCISRQAVIDLIQKSNADLQYYNENEQVCIDIMALPSVTPQPQKGHWIDEGFYAEGHSEHVFMCSECEWHHIERKNELVDFKYCPFCGADMREVEE